MTQPDPSKLKRYVVEGLYQHIGKQERILLEAHAAETGLSIGEYIVRLLKGQAKWLETHDGVLFREKVEEATANYKAIPRKRQHHGKSRAYRQAMYLEAIYDSANLRIALETVKLSPSMPYHWAREDPEFREKWNAARMWCGKSPY